MADKRRVPESVAGKLYAAADVIADGGLEHARIEDIAAASGVPKATLYYYFAGKDDILSFLLRDSLAHMAAEVATAAESPGTGKDRLVAVVTAQMEHTMRRPGTARALVGDLGHAIRLPELAHLVQQAFFDPLATVLTAGAADRSLRTVDDPQSCAVGIFGLVVMTAMQHNVVQSEKSVADVTDSALDLIVNGVSPPG